jgi:PAS domain S-box-containing protein
MEQEEEAGRQRRPVTSGSALGSTGVGAAALFELALEATGDGLMYWTLGDGTIHYSLRWKMLLGYEDHELPSTPRLWRDLSHPDDLPRVSEMMREHLVAFFPLACTWRMAHRNGEWRWVLCRGLAIRDAEGVATHLLAIFTDITEQVHAEERQKALATAVPDLMVRVRRDGLVLDEKRDAAGGLLPGPAVGRWLTEAAGNQLWSHQAVAAVGQAVESGEVVCQECMAGGPGLAPDGKGAAPTSFLELRVVRSGADEAVCIIRDITERKLAERRERELQAQLEEMHLAERKRLASELEIAAHLQTALLPDVVPVSGLEICGKMRPATEVGGDYFDVLPCPDGAWIAIGDVSGHGLNAGMVMLMVQSAIACRVTEEPNAHPAAVLASVNRVLFQNIRQRMKSDEFVTLTLLRYWDDGRVVFAGAHEEVIIYRAASGEIKRIPSPGTWLGILAEVSAKNPETHEQLQPGDVLVLHTDGVTEARSPTNEQFGVSRLAALVTEHHALPVSEMPERILSDVSRWATTQEDDMSLVVARHRAR